MDCLISELIGVLVYREGARIFILENKSKVENGAVIFFSTLKKYGDRIFEGAQSKSVQALETLFSALANTKTGSAFRMRPFSSPLTS